MTTRIEEARAAIDELDFEMDHTAGRKFEAILHPLSKEEIEELFQVDFDYEDGLKSEDKWELRNKLRETYKSA